MNLKQQPYGATGGGNYADLYTLTNNQGVTLSLTNYGGIITTLHTPDRKGQGGDIVLGYEKLEEYLARNPFFGCLVGRFGNRIAGGKFTLKGKEYRLAQNNGQNHLHGGTVGFDKVLWAAEPFTTPASVGVKLTYTSVDGEEGYPGNLAVTVVYTLTDTNEFQINYSATTDQSTILNLTNHTYFNLRGEGDILDHLMQINADSFTPVDNTLIPTGEIRPVAGTPLDFRTPTRIGKRIEQNDEQLAFGKGYDQNFVVQGTPGELRRAAVVRDPSSGRTLEVLTTQPGVQFYSGNVLPDLMGKGGQAYQRRSGFCLETQHFPDSPNQPTFPSVVLEPGEKYAETTVWKFGVE
ncbi:MAG: galactose mutarotase [Caldilineaceae bacterium]|nr:galactose mutarotase [Caldilineaceae bacterium]